LIKSAVAIVDDFYRYEAQLKPHLKEFLAQLHETGVKMCIATATERSLVEAALARCGVLDYFSEIFTCSSVGAGKDEPTIYREALNFLGTDRTNTMVFEDSLHALTTAKKDGFYTTAVYDSHEENQEEIQRLANCRKSLLILQKIYRTFYLAESLIASRYSLFNQVSTTLTQDDFFICKMEEGAVASYGN